MSQHLSKRCTFCPELDLFPCKLYRKDGIHKDMLSKDALQEILSICLQPSPYSATYFWIGGDAFCHGFMVLQP